MARLKGFSTDVRKCYKSVQTITAQHLCDGIAEVTPDGGERLRHFFDLSHLAAPVRPLLLL